MFLWVKYGNIYIQYIIVEFVINFANISLCYVSNFFSLPIPPIIGPRQPSLSNSFPHFFFFLFFFFLTLPLLFIQYFLSLFGPSSPPLCRYSLPNDSTPFLALLLLYFAVTLYPTIPLSFWPFFSPSSFLSHITVILLTTLLLPFCLFFSSLFHILPL